MKEKISSFLFAAALVTASTLAPLAAGETMKWLWKIDGEPYTMEQFEQDYESYLILAASQMNISVTRLKLFLEPESGDSEQLVQLREQMSRENFAENFKTVQLINRHANQTGYLENPGVAEKRKFFLTYFTAQIYLMDYLEKNMPLVTENEVMERWIEERKQNPTLKNVTIENGLHWMRQQIEREKLAQLRVDAIETMYKKYNVEDHPQSFLKKRASSKETPSSPESEKGTTESSPEN